MHKERNVECGKRAVKLVHGWVIWRHKESLFLYMQQ